MSENAPEHLKQLNDGFNIDEEAEDERLASENPDVYHEREWDKVTYEAELQQAAKRRLTKL